MLPSLHTARLNDLGARFQAGDPAAVEEAKGWLPGLGRWQAPTLAGAAAGGALRGR
jgi:hypothetical protein